MRGTGLTAPHEHPAWEVQLLSPLSQLPQYRKLRHRKVHVHLSKVTELVVGWDLVWLQTLKL